MRRAACTLAEAFTEVAARFPERAAVTTPYQNLSYRRLDERADELAGQLVRMGIGAGHTVALVVPRSAELIVGMLGILKAGAAYLPIDPAFPPARVSWTIKDSGSCVVVSSTQAASALNGAEASVILADRLPTRPSANRPALPPGDPDSVAYVIYTSGSTGDPKGVQVEQHSLLRLFDTTRERFGFSESDVWTVFHSAAFDFSIWEIWGALLFGGRMVLVPQDVARSPAALHDLLREQKVTVLNLTPSAFRPFAAADGRSGRWLEALRLVVFGGERLDPASLRGWMERYGDERPRLVNMYGITEAVIHASYRRVMRSDLECAGSSPIGSPLPGMTFHLLDENGTPVPAGLPGELYIESTALARGYLGRPHLNAERFADCPGPDGTRHRRLRTGDQVVALPSGEYGYLGRADDQIKIRGYRIEPGEIESFLAGQAEVSQAVVVPQEYGDDDVRLVAYVVARAATPAMADTLRERAAARLPAHMCPSRYVMLDELPLTLNGKVDKALLHARGRWAR